MPAGVPGRLRNSRNGSPRIGVLMSRLLLPVAPVFATNVLSVKVRDPAPPAAMVKLPLKEKTKVVLTGAVRVAVDAPAAVVPQIAAVVFQSPEVRVGSQKRPWARTPGAARIATRNDAASRRPATPDRFCHRMTHPRVKEAAGPAGVMMPHPRG